MFSSDMVDPADATSRRLDALWETMRAFAEATTDYQRLLGVVATRMTHHGADGCVLVLVDGDGASFTSPAVHFTDPAAMAVARDLLSAKPESVGGRSLGAQLLETRRRILIPKVDLEELSKGVAPAYAAVAARVGIHSLIFLPLEVHGHVVGVMALARVAPSAPPFDANDAAVHEHLAGHAALAISNAQLLEAQKREIEQRKRAEEQARRYEALVDHSTDFIAMATLEGRILFINEAGRALIGIPPEEDIGALDIGRFHTGDGLQRRAAIRETGRWQGRGQLRHFATGELIDTEVSSFLVRTPEGEPFAYATVQRDIRETLRMEAHLRQMQRLDAIGRLAGGIAHDFNNILSIVLSYASTALMDLPADSPVRGDVEEILTAGRRAAGLTNQLLVFSRQQVLEPSIANVNEIVLGMKAMLRRLLGEDVRLETSLASNLGRIKVDVGQMEQVILNLAINARDAMPRGGALTIATENASHEGAPYVVLQVTDTGMGMDEALQQRIFEPFFSTKPQGKGTGLGLSTVFGIAKQSGGHVHVWSEPDRGARFRIYLPRSGDAEAPAAKRGESARPATSSAETILIVEDDEQVRRLLVKILVGAGYRVVQAAGPVEALRIAAPLRGSIDLLLTDVVMPEMNGRQLAERLLRSDPKTKVLYVSGYLEAAIGHEGVLDPGIQLLQKPVTRDTLLRRVRETLDA